MKQTIEIEISDEENAVTVPFDMGNAGTFSLNATAGDRDDVVLELDRAACKSFAELFIQLAFGKHKDFHFHMGRNETPESSHGLRIELKD